MDLTKIGDKVLVLSHIKYYVLIFLLTLTLYFGDVIYQIFDDCKIDPLASRGYLISNLGCTIPNYLTYSIKEHPKIESCKSPNFVKSTKEIIYIDRLAFENTTWKLENFKCEYCPFNERRLFKNCPIKYNLTSTAKINDVYVWVTCSYNNMEIYNDFFTFPLNEIAINENIDFKEKKVNVIVWGLGGVSRAAFHRQFNQTAYVLNKLHAVQYFGYNKIGEDSISNLIPLLSGLKAETFFKRKLNPSKTIFDYFKESGYLTSFAEDGYQLSKLQFKNVDFFWSSEYLNYNKKACVKDKIIKYTEKLIDDLISKGNFFALIWCENFAAQDEELSKFLLHLLDTKVLRNTIFILLSEHGNQNNDLRLTHLGSIEDRLPLLYIYLPRLYRNRYRGVCCNLLRNSDRLITSFDIHKTLVEMKDPFNTIYDTSNQAISLFSLVSTRRTCKHAGISPHFCTCHGFKDVNVKENISIQLADYASKYIEDINHFSNKNVTKVLTNRMHITTDENYNDYTVLFKIEHCYQFFEATIRKIKNVPYFKLLDRVSEITKCDCCL